MCLSQKYRAEGHHDTCLKTLILMQLMTLLLLAFLQKCGLSLCFFFYWRNLLKICFFILVYITSYSHNCLMCCECIIPIPYYPSIFCPSTSYQRPLLFLFKNLTFIFMLYAHCSQTQPSKKCQSLSHSPKQQDRQKKVEVHGISLNKL